MRPALLLPAAVIALILSRPSLAAAGDEDNPQAQTFFLEGRAALERGDHAAACASFQQSLALVRRASTLLNLGQCEQETGKLVASLTHWQEGMALLPTGDERVAIARERAAAVATRLPHLAIRLDGPALAGTRIALDGTEMPLDRLAAGVPVDPGRHEVVLQVPGAADQQSTLNLVEREAKMVTLAPITPASVPKAPPAAGRSGGLRTGGFALLGLGGAGLVVAGVTGGILLSKHSTIGAECDAATHVCSPAGLAAINSAPPLNVANAAGWVAAVTGLAGGVALVIVGKMAPATVTPTALPGGGGLWMSRRF